MKIYSGGLYLYRGEEDTTYFYLFSEFRKMEVVKTKSGE